MDIFFFRTSTDPNCIYQTEVVPADDGPPAKKKRTAVFQWTEKWVCDHGGKFRDRTNQTLLPTKRRPNRSHASIKVECGAWIWVRKRVGTEELEIEYKWKHDNHSVGSLKDMRESRMAERVKQWVDTRVREGLDWKAIKDLLRVDQEMLERVRPPA